MDEVIRYSCTVQIPRKSAPTGTSTMMMVEMEMVPASDYDKLRERVAELEAAITSCLPCSYYMDLPDGGSPSLEEQLRRMAKDAADQRAAEHRLKEVASHCATVEQELAALKAQEPVAEVRADCIGYINWLVMPQSLKSAKLYAAPVAKQEVVMPERLDENSHLDVWNSAYAAGHNDALKKVARLNGGKPNE